MTPRHSAELLLLSALWGASFLFMRLAAGEFGPVALTAVRVAIGALVLASLLAWHGLLGELRRHWIALTVVGLVSSALPFIAFGYAALAITAGLSSIFNATTPLWGALVAWAWLGERPSALRALGLAIGFAGVLGLGAGKASFTAAGGGVSSGAAILACLAATAMYGFGANYTRRRLAGVAPLTVAAGSQITAAALLALPLPWAWPAAPPSLVAWGAAVALGVLCTGLAYILYFRLIAQVGAAQAMTVTYLIPLFAVFWGWLVLDETVTPAMAVGGAVILLGTALATGVVGPRQAARVLTRD
ncbi:DMT family transporter [Calidifontimicrobium sp. SYSU G02091]|uniref:DMT family transporter n=1 Tax=Calidifontimicrobium sp. SYSU G02091 TaxID=2926421 RepID=UPI001F53028B|nr:DMT family transporter [Calidifontimicrobium sp. SYSU G02091]MCI1191352.1 DMT family transporter [Calidifontimicrobium sp. SYSU G02091]